jgi:flagellar assembly protein FliH
MIPALMPIMKSYKAITFTAPIRDVCLTATASRFEIEQHRQAAETAAYERGRRDGEKALGEQLLQQRAEILELHQGVVQSLRNAIPQLIQQTEETLIGLTLEAAQKIVADIPISTKLVEAVVREATGQLEDHTEITVLLHPEDLALLRKHQSPILSETSETRRPQFNSSSEITRGGCMIQTRFGLLDARRETKIEQLRKSLAP